MEQITLPIREDTGLFSQRWIEMGFDGTYRLFVGQFKDEIRDWCFDQGVRYQIQPSGDFDTEVDVHFEDAKGAVAFKLRWL